MNQKQSLLLIPTLVALLTLVAYPCSYIIISHQLDPIEQKLDRLPPSAPQMSLLSIKRGRGPRPDSSGSSCDDIGEIILKLDQAARDDRTQPEKMGYLWQVRDGQLPEDLGPPTRPVRLTVDGRLLLIWVDGSTDDQEPLEFSITITAFDLAGNQSQPSEAVQIRHPGHR